MNPYSEEVSVKLAVHCRFCFLRKREQIPSQEPGTAVLLTVEQRIVSRILKKRSNRKTAAA